MCVCVGVREEGEGGRGGGKGEGGRCRGEGHRGRGKGAGKEGGMKDEREG